MGRKGEIGGNLNEEFWKAGWFWLYPLVGGPVSGVIAGYAIGGALGWLVGLALFFGGPGLGIAGLVYVHRNIDEILEAGLDVVKREAAEVARVEGAENETFTMVTKRGDSHPLLPAPKRDVTTMVVGESLLLVHDKAVVNLPFLTWEVGQSTQEFYFDQIASVNFQPFDDLDERIAKREYDEAEDIEVKEGGLFYINTSDGHGGSWETATDANQALAAVQDRLRAYKSQQAGNPA